MSEIRAHEAKYIIDNGPHIVAEKEEAPSTTIQSDYKSRSPLIGFLGARRFLSGKFVAYVHAGETSGPEATIAVAARLIVSSRTRTNPTNQPTPGPTAAAAKGDASSVTRWLRPATRGGDWGLTGTVLP